MDEKQLKKEIQESKVTIRIGHNSEMENIISEIKDQLKSRKVIKLKANKGVLDSSSRKYFWQDLAESSNSKFVSRIGNIGILMRKI